ncbi:MAG: transporter substrate-binding domain-containing protein, partial [Desulfobacteraceae bacterium]|nr:transporter substrate-binding domain-containing protein [Desulfobacteraceae bacterium]
MRKIVILIAIVLFCTPAFAQKPIKIVYFENFAPFSWKENNQMHGILIDVLTEAIQERIKIGLLHEGYPWARAQSMVRTGKADAFVTVPTPERRAYTEISSEPV